jgi:hypothetical protein
MAIRHALAGVDAVSHPNAQAGWPFVRPVWKRYLRDRDERFVNPYEFAIKFDYWLGTSNESKDTLDRIEAMRAWTQVLGAGRPYLTRQGVYYVEADVASACGDRAARAFVAAGGSGAFGTLDERSESYVRERFVKAWLSLG